MRAAARGAGATALVEWVEATGEAAMAAVAVEAAEVAARVAGAMGLEVMATALAVERWVVVAQEAGAAEV